MIPPKDSHISPDAQPIPKVWKPFPELPQIRGGFSTKADGGMSWTGMDSRDTVENRRAYLRRYGLDLSSCVGADQVHGCEITHVDRQHTGRGAADPDSRIPATDGLITSCPGVVLTTLHADCAPLFFTDPIASVVGLAHIGWRGAIAGLGGKMIDRLRRGFHIDPAKTRIAVGPMISKDRYVVGHEVAEVFRNRYGSGVLSEYEDGIHLDLFAALVLNIENALGREIHALPRPVCTASNADFWSFRRDGESSRSMMAWLTIVSA